MEGCHCRSRMWRSRFTLLTAPAGKNPSGWPALTWAMASRMPCSVTRFFSGSADPLGSTAMKLGRIADRLLRKKLTITW